jgi:hypothetical protein
MSGETSEARARWESELARLRPDLLRDAVGWGVKCAAENLIAELDAQVAELRAEAARLRLMVPADPGPACYRSAAGAMVHGPGCRHDI